MYALVVAVLSCVTLVVGFLFGAKQGRDDARRCDRLLAGYVELWLTQPPETSRAVHEVLDRFVPELHDEFHAQADERLADRGHGETLN